MAEAIDKRRRIGRVINVDPELFLVGKKDIHWTDTVADLPAERAVVAHVLAKPPSFYELAPQLSPADFYDLMNGYMWLAYERIVAQDATIDLVEVVRELKKEESLTKLMPNADYDAIVASYLAAPGSEDNLERNVKAIQDAAIRIRLGQDFERLHKNILLNPRLLIDDVIEQVEGAVYASTGRRSKAQQSDIAAHIKARQAQIFSFDQPEHFPVKTGFPEFDSKMGESLPGYLYVLAGNQGMGKTTWFLTVLYNMVSANTRAIVFSQEMNAQLELLPALVQMKTGIHRSKIRDTRQLGPEEFSLMMTAYENMVERLGGKVALVDDERPLTPTRLRTRIRRELANMDRLDVVMIDGLWLMETEPPESRPDKPELRNIRNDLDKYGYLATELISIAEQFHIPIWITAQYKTDVFHRPNRTPQLSDLEYGLKLRMTAQVIMAMHRPSFYGDSEEAMPDLTQIHILKDRAGGVANNPKKRVIHFDYDIIHNLYMEADVTDADLS